MHHINENHEVDGNNNRVPQTQCNTPARSTQSSKDKEDGSISAGVGSKGGWFRVPNWPIAKKLIGWGAAAVALIMILYYLLKEDEKDNACTAEANQYKSQRESDGTLDTTKTDNDIRIIRANTESKIAIENNKHEHKIAEIQARQQKQPAQEISYEEVQRGVSWFENFYNSFRNPKHIPLALAEFLCDERVGNRLYMPRLLNLINMYGAFCFPRCRASYNRQDQGPTIQLIVEGPQETGKSVLADDFEKFFKPLLSADKHDTNHICQVLDTDLTNGEFKAFLSRTKGLHAFLLATEINDVHMWLQTKKIDMGKFRDLYDTHSDGNTPSLSYTMTGTKDQVDRFLRTHMTDGTTGRNSFVFLPKGKTLKKGLPYCNETAIIHEYLEYHRNLRVRYACKVNDKGEEVPVDIFRIDLSYVEKRLNKWKKKQLKKAKKEQNPCRADHVNRVALNAFRASIVTHMMYLAPYPMLDEPKVALTEDEKLAVENIAVFIANYLMERLVHRFGATYNQKAMVHAQAELVNCAATNTYDEDEDDGDDEDDMT